MNERQSLVGACGRHVDSFCFPGFEDDLCATCQYNAWCGDGEDSEEEICNYTGEQCFGNPMFCEECEAWCGDSEDSEEEICDYTGEQCFGNPMFCEECEVVLGDTQ